MARKTLMSDGHVQLSDSPQTATPPGFDGPDSGAFCPQWFGRIMENPDSSGFGAAYISQEDY